MQLQWEAAQSEIRASGPGIIDVGFVFTISVDFLCLEPPECLLQGAPYSASAPAALRTDAFAQVNSTDVICVLTHSFPNVDSRFDENVPELTEISSWRGRDTERKERRAEAFSSGTEAPLSQESSYLVLSFTFFPGLL